MRTMPRYQIRIMRLFTEAMLTWIARWEDRNADVRDGRVARLTTGLWQASTELRYLAEGSFPEGPDAPLTFEPGRWNPGKVLGDTRYVGELIDSAPIPLRPAD